MPRLDLAAVVADGDSRRRREWRGEDDVHRQAERASSAREKKRVMVAAGDTFRAGAIDQLRVWAERTGAEFVGAQAGADPGAVAFDAIDSAIARGVDVLIVDTAGRLHTSEGLMDELKKVARVIAKRLPGAPHETLLVLDGTIGQNAVQQAKNVRRRGSGVRASS